MALIIGFPQPGEVWGPGFVLTVSTDLIGPQPPGTVWEIDLEAMESSIVWGRWTVPFVFNAISTTWVNGTPSSSNVIAPRHLLTTGDDARLHVKLKQSDGTVVDEEDVAIVVDMEQGQAWQVQEYIRTHQQVIPPGLTEEQAESLVITQAAVTAGFGISPLDLVGDLVQAIATSNPLGYGSLSSPADCFTGDGTMPDPEPLLPKWGLYWVASVIPAELGHRHGQSEEYPSRLVQFRTVHEVGGVELVTEIVDATTHGELWRFRFQRPRRVEYSVLPGVTICAQWWQFP